MYALRPHPVEFNKVWYNINDTINRILSLQPVDRQTWNFSFSDIYFLCVAVPESQCTRLYNAVKECIQTHVKHVFELAFEIWKDQLLTIKERLVKLLLDQIELDRRSFDVSVGDIRDVILSFVAVTDRYGSINETVQGIPLGNDKPRPLIDLIFERPFLETTKEYFRIISTVNLADLNCSEYMKKVLKIRQEEQERASRFLYFTSREKVERLSSEILVEAQKYRFDAVCRQMIEQEALDDLQNMYRCLKPVPNGFNVLLSELSDFIRTTGISSVNANVNNDPAEFVSAVYILHFKFVKIVQEVFQNENEFTSTLDKAMELVVNYKSEERQISKASERVNRFIDSILRRSNKGMSETEMETKLNMALVIFRFIEDKDVFEKYYSKLFASRLIMNNSTSREMEEQMIKKMKEACGYEFTNKLSRMFTDIGLSEELTKDFNEGQEIKIVPSTFLILQSAAWPISSDPNAEHFPLPSELEHPMLKFDEFYKEKHHGRKLSWINHLANAEVRLNYLDRAYIVTMSVEQYTLLSLFENQDQSTVKELASNIGISSPLVIKALRGLLDGNVLTSPDAELGEESSIFVNLSLTNKRLRFKISAPLAQKNTKDTTNRVIDTVQQDRKLCIECIIVRVMKARKVMKHGELVNEVINQAKSRFTPDVTTIKQCISQLIEKLYMQRTDDFEEYQYLA